MASIDMVMPKMGESIMEATILQWLKKEGDTIEQDESVLEVATDKVDTEVPASESGILKKILVKEGDIIEIGKPIAVIEVTETNGTAEPSPKPETTKSSQVEDSNSLLVDQEEAVAINQTPEKELATTAVKSGKAESDRFYSPLVRNIAKEEGISMSVLDQIPGTGKEGRLTKKDLFNYLETEKKQPAGVGKSAPKYMNGSAEGAITQEQDEIIAMNRMRKMIATRMIDSKNISAHVTSFVEADVTNLVKWRNRVKNEFKNRENEALTFTPIFIEVVAKALKEFPMINVSVEGDNIIKKRNINIGMAVALADGNLIVPVIKNADQFSLLGLAKQVNDLANRARENKLTADEVSDGTYTISNIGAFGNIMGTPIIVQPQVAILALGTIVKKPAVIETPQGDAIAIRHKIYLSHSYDHRVVDGALGGLFVKRVADLLENFDTTQSI